MKNSSAKKFNNCLIALFLFCFVAISFYVHAQTGILSGNVTGAAGAALPGASVKVKGTNHATKTNERGEFSFQELSFTNPTLIVSYIGYQDKEVKPSVGQTNFVISLSEKTSDIDEIVVTGVFDKRKKNGSICCHYNS